MLSMSFDDARGYSKDVMEKSRAADPGIVVQVDEAVMILRTMAVDFDLDLTDPATVASVAKGILIGSQLALENIITTCGQPLHPVQHIAQALHVTLDAVDELGVLTPAVPKDRSEVHDQIIEDARKALQGQAPPATTLSDSEFEAGLRDLLGDEPGADR